MKDISKISDEMCFFEDVKAFFKAIENRPIRYWVYKRMFTPYELEHKFMDESVFEDSYATEGYIKEVVLLPDNDVLLGIARGSEINSEDDDYTYMVDYHKLSEIRMSYHLTIEEGDYDVTLE